MNELANTLRMYAGSNHYDDKCSDAMLEAADRLAELEKERDQLIQAVADHVTARCELAAQNVAIYKFVHSMFPTFNPNQILENLPNLAEEVLKRRDAEIDLAADRLEVLEREHAEFFDRWHGERRMREKLVDDVERCYRMLLSEPNAKGALFKAGNILREALADAKASTFVPVRLSDGLE